MKICAIGLRGIPDVMGGIETHCEQLYAHLGSEAEDIDLTVVGRSGYVTRTRVGAVDVRPVWAPKQKFLETLIHTPLAILYARLFIHPQIVHLHGIGPGFFAPLVRILGFKLVATHHAMDYDRPKWSTLGRAFLKTGEFMIAKSANRIICVSDGLRRMLISKYPNTNAKTVTILNGAPPPPRDLPPSGEVLAELGLTRKSYILAVGRLDPTKGFDVLVAAFNASSLRETHVLAIAGGALGTDEYSKLLMQKKSPNVRFLGRQPAAALRRLYENTALFVHPSHLEGFPLVVMEALGAGAPILVSDIAPHQEVGLPGECYFPEGNVAELVSRLDGGQFDKLRQGQGASILEKTDWSKLAVQHAAVFASLSRRHPSAAGAS